jgi:hypothetical protein
VAVEPVDKEVALETVRQKFSLWRRVVSLFAIPLLAVPILACVPLAHALAGKHTTVTITVGVTVSIAITAAFGITVRALWTRNSRQTEELRRQRERITELERERDELREQIRALPKG